MPIEDFPLHPNHLAALRGSAISDEVIRARGYRTITAEDELAALGFGVAQRRVPGLLLPLHTTDASPGLAVYRPDNPRVFEDRTRREPDGAHPCKVIKYELPKGSGARLDCPPLCRPLLADPSIPLWVTEGQKKADALCSLRAASVALLGVWNFTGKNPSGGITFLADWQYIALQGRRVYIVFDSDVMKKPSVAQALARLKEHLQRKGAVVSAVYLPAAAGWPPAGRWTVWRRWPRRRARCPRPFPPRSSCWTAPRSRCAARWPCSTRPRDGAPSPRPGCRCA